MAFVELHRLGQPFLERPMAFYLALEDFIEPLNPKDYGDKGPVIDPKEFFITSGDAINKTLALEKRLLEIAENSTNRKLVEAAYGRVGRVRSMMNKMLLARGPNQFFECEWQTNESGRVLAVLSKNPRPRD